MTGGIIAIIILVVLIALIAVWVISVQRRLVSIDELCSNAMSQIGVQQNTRWDALNALADLTKQYDEHEYNTLKDVISHRQAITANSTAADAEAQENFLTQAMSRFMAVAEAYPDLKANTMYTETMQGVKQYEENVRLARMTYNDTVTKFNRVVRQFPTSIVAGMLGFPVKDYLQTEEAKKDMPDMKR
ncbi:MAG: LemA family protein [Clostridia bacterium]|nr:LemA family protein [Clostridia bacterium]